MTRILHIFRETAGFRNCDLSQQVVQYGSSVSGRQFDVIIAWDRPRDRGEYTWLLSVVFARAVKDSKIIVPSNLFRHFNPYGR